MRQNTPLKSLKSIESDIQGLKNRIDKLKFKSQEQQSSIKKHKSLAHRILSTKVEKAKQLARLREQNNEKTSLEKQYLQKLKEQNKQKRGNHKEEINNIMKAVYLVKVDDARQMKQISEKHRHKIRELNSSLIDQKRKKVSRINSEQNNERKQQFWKEKLGRLYLENQAKKIRDQENIHKKMQQFQKLKTMEESMLDTYHRRQQVHHQTKQEYIQALSLPIRQAASMIQMKKKNTNHLVTQRKQTKFSQKRAKNFFQENQEEEQEIKTARENQIFPKTEVSEIKLKIVLERLKKKTKQKS